MTKKTVVIIGPQCVGKTHLLNSIADRQLAAYQPTIGVDFTHSLEGQQKYYWWEISGQPRFAFLSKTYLAMADAVVFVIDDKVDAEDVQFWLQQYQQFASQVPCLWLINANLPAKALIEWPVQYRHHWLYYQADGKVLRQQIVSKLFPSVDRQSCLTSFFQQPSSVEALFLSPLGRKMRDLIMPYLMDAPATSPLKTIYQKLTLGEYQTLSDLINAIEYAELPYRHPLLTKLESLLPATEMTIDSQKSPAGGRLQIR